MARIPILELLLLVLLSFLWGASFTLIEVAVDTIPPATIVFARLTIGAVMLVLLAFWLGTEFPKSGKLWLALLVQGFLQSALPFTLISWGQQYISSGLAGLLNTTPPMFVFLIGYFFQGHRDHVRSRAIGVLFGFAGALIILGPAALAGDDRSVLGQIAVTGASLSYALAALWAARLSGISVILAAACSMTFAALLMAPVSILVDDPLRLTPTREAMLAVITLGIFSTAIAMVIYFRLVRTLGALIVATGSYLRAAFSVMLGVMLLGEAVTLELFVGILLIFAGIAAVSGHSATILRLVWKKED